MQKESVLTIPVGGPGWAPPFMWELLLLLFFTMCVVLSDTIHRNAAVTLQKSIPQCRYQLPESVE